MPNSIPILSRYQYFTGIASEANKVLTIDLRNTLKQLLNEYWKNSSDDFIPDAINVTLGILKPNFKNHIQNITDEKREQKKIMMKKLENVYYIIDSMNPKNITKAIKILNEKGLLDTIEFIEDLNGNKAGGLPIKLIRIMRVKYSL